MKLSQKNIPGLFFLVLFISTGLVPNFSALDRIATQWLYLSVINSLGLIYFLYSDKTKSRIKTIFKFKPFLFLLIFSIWGVLSVFYSINKTEVIVKFIRWIQLPISFVILTFIYFELKKEFVNAITILVSVVLILELYFSYSTYLQITEITKYDFSYANLLKGATGNKNITAASVLIKIPFVIYLIFNFKNRVIKYICGILIFATSYLVFILSARSAIIAFFAMIVIISVWYILKSISKKKLILNVSFGITFASFFLSLLFFQINFRNDNSASLTNRASSINIEDESTRQRVRFYKHSLNQITENPIFGVGLGNWKIKSIDYDKKDINGYIVPYHTHNDFLEIGTELGIVGMALYLLIFFYSIYSILRSNSEKLFGIDILIIVFGIIYFIDANLNFPHARPVMQVPFLLGLALTFIHQNEKNKFK